MCYAGGRGATLRNGSSRVDVDSEPVASGRGSGVTRRLVRCFGGRRVGVVASVLLVVACAAGCDWTMFGYGPDHLGASPDTSISPGALTNNELALAWMGDTCVNAGASSAAVANGVAYVASAVGVAAFDA